jgi:hypothetical protein
MSLKKSFLNCWCPVALTSFNHHHDWLIEWITDSDILLLNRSKGMKKINSFFARFLHLFFCYFSEHCSLNYGVISFLHCGNILKPGNKEYCLLHTFFGQLEITLQNVFKIMHFTLILASLYTHIMIGTTWCQCNITVAQWQLTWTWRRDHFNEVYCIMEEVLSSVEKWHQLQSSDSWQLPAPKCSPRSMWLARSLQRKTSDLNLG